MYVILPGQKAPEGGWNFPADKPETVVSIGETNRLIEQIQKYQTSNTKEVTEHGVSS